MYIKDTGFSYGVFRNGDLVAEFETYEEAKDYISLERYNYFAG